jgi:hypothetical protein
MSSQERQSIISALKGAGHAMSISQIMAAVERTDRNAVDQLLHKMRKAGEIEVAGRGLYTLGKIGAPVSAPDQSDRQSDQRPNLTDRDVAAPDVAGNLTEESPTVRVEPKQPKQSPETAPWVISDVDAARRADQFRAARKDKGDLIATRALRWGLQDAGVLYEQLEREVDRIRALAASGRAILKG